eukprot:438942_1
MWFADHRGDHMDCTGWQNETKHRKNKERLSDKTEKWPSKPEVSAHESFPADEKIELADLQNQVELLKKQRKLDQDVIRRLRAQEVAHVSTKLPVRVTFLSPRTRLVDDLRTLHRRLWM